MRSLFTTPRSYHHQAVLRFAWICCYLADKRAVVAWVYCLHCLAGNRVYPLWKCRKGLLPTLLWMYYVLLIYKIEISSVLMKSHYVTLWLPLFNESGLCIFLSILEYKRVYFEKTYPLDFPIIQSKIFSKLWFNYFWAKSVGLKVVKHVKARFSKKNFSQNICTGVC